MSREFLYRACRDINTVGWYRIASIKVYNDIQPSIRLNLCIGTTFWYYASTYIDFDLLILTSVIGKQNICISCDDGKYLPIDKLRLYYESTTKKYYLDVHHKSTYINACGVLITNKSTSLTDTYFYPENLVLIDDTIPDTTKMKLEYSFVVDE